MSIQYFLCSGLKLHRSMIGILFWARTRRARTSQARRLPMESWLTRAYFHGASYNKVTNPLEFESRNSTNDNQRTKRLPPPSDAQTSIFHSRVFPLKWVQKAAPSQCIGQANAKSDSHFYWVVNIPLRRRPRLRDAAGESKDTRFGKQHAIHHRS
jgi:hypothetical protein